MWTSSVQEVIFMSFQTVFDRYEMKYLIDADQKNNVLKAMQPYMMLDKYGRTTIRNIYYDTDDYRIVRNSIAKPIYKEKLRIRSYSKATSESTVFVELKKKYESKVYKRRIPLLEKDASCWIAEQNNLDCSNKDFDYRDFQIVNEIEYFKDFYENLKPKAFIAYEREAFYTNEPSDFRVTFDENILCRFDGLSLQNDVSGEAILPSGKTLLEIKCSGGIPMWMAIVLSENRIYKSTFSKYGIAYERYIYPLLNGKKKELVNV